MMEMVIPACLTSEKRYSPVVTKKAGAAASM